MSTPRRRGIDYEQVGSDYLEKRSLPRPAIAWNSIRALKQEVRARATERRPEPVEGRPSSP